MYKLFKNILVIALLAGSAGLVYFKFFKTDIASFVLDIAEENKDEVKVLVKQGNSKRALNLTDPYKFYVDKKDSFTFLIYNWDDRAGGWKFCSETDSVYYPVNGRMPIEVKGCLP